MIANVAIEKRRKLEAELINIYEGQLVEISHINTKGFHDPNAYLSGEIRTIGLDWIGGDEFEVIINLEGIRMVIPYQDFTTNTTVI